MHRWRNTPSNGADRAAGVGQAEVEETATAGLVPILQRPPRAVANPTRGIISIVVAVAFVRILFGAYEGADKNFRIDSRG